MQIPKVISTIVGNDLCTGCGLCVYKCPQNAITMEWNKFGFLNPSLTGDCDSCGNCLSVCPFNPFPEEEVETENELADQFLQSKHRHFRIGKYNTIYAGYAKDFRLQSSSGGIASYLLAQLLEQNIVDHVVSVKDSDKREQFFEYCINSSAEELRSSSKTRYYPVSLGKVMSELNNMEGKVAIIGVACFIKAVRLAQYYEPELKQKIPFLAGIICGGMKSRFFTEYLASQSGVDAENIEKPQFRIKDLNSTANDYAFGCINSNDAQKVSVKMKSLGDMWGTGLFKNNACDYCDDVTTELADISFGDAWLSPYNKEGAGTNVLLIRSKLAEDIILTGIRKGAIIADELSLDRFLTSQKGSFNHRHKGLSVRIKHAKEKNIPVPPKRFGNEKVTRIFAKVQKIRMEIRQSSVQNWLIEPDATVFDAAMKKKLKKLKIATKLYHYRRTFNKEI